MGFVDRYSRPGPTLKRVRSDRVCAQSALIPRKVHTDHTFLCHVINQPCPASSGCIIWTRGRSTLPELLPEESKVVVNSLEKAFPQLVLKHKLMHNLHLLLK